MVKWIKFAFSCGLFIASSAMSLNEKTAVNGWNSPNVHKIKKTPNCTITRPNSPKFSRHRQQTQKHTVYALNARFCHFSITNASAVSQIFHTALILKTVIQLLRPINLFILIYIHIYKFSPRVILFLFLLDDRVL